MNGRNKTKNSKKNFATEEKKDLRVLLDLAEVCGPMKFISETDAEIEPFVVSAPRSGSLRAYLDVLGIKDKDVEEVEFEEFFARLTDEKDWHGSREKERSSRFEKLRKVLKQYLDDLRVIRAGNIRIDIYVVGIDASGHLAGVKTHAIET